MKVNFMVIYIQPFFDWLLETTLIGSVVICLILLIQKALGGKLGPRWCHALWLVLLIRMVLPWAPSSRLSLFNLIPSWDQQAQPQQPSETAERQESSEASRTSRTTEATSSQKPKPDVAMQEQTTVKPITLADSQNASKGRLAPLRQVLPALWLLGAIVIGAYVLVSDLALWRIVKRDRPLVNQAMLELLEECKAQMGVQTLAAIVPSSQIRSPGLFGFIRPRLLLPPEMIETATRDEMRYVFLHELAHLKRHDIYLGWLTSLLQVLHWFNPLVWFAFYRMRADRELACDALVLARTGEGESQQYGQTIVGLLRRFSRSRALPAMAGILETKSQLKRRMTMIAQFRNNSHRWSPLGIGVIAVLGTISMIDPTRGTVSASSAPQAKTPMTMRLVEKGVWGDVSMSPDRRYLCHTGWGGTGEITVRELATGEQRTIKPTKRLREEYDPDCPIMSPDNKTIAYLVGFQERADVCLIGADGSGQRVLYPGVIRSIREPAGSGQRLPYPGRVRPIQWFPDGSHILAIRWPDPMHAFTEIEIVSVSIADGSVQVIKALAGEFYGTTIRLSPDAKTVAYELTSKDAPKKHDIFAIEIDSKRETPLVVHAADDRLLDWTPDGNRILSISDRIGPWSVWLLPVAKGQAQGTPELVARSSGSVRPVGFAENGSYYYGMRYYDCDIYTAVINMTTGQLLSAPAPLEAAGSNEVADWSPDGKYLAYCSHSATSDEPGVIRIRSLATGQERELVNKLTGFDCLRWSPDGRSLLASWLIAYKNEDVALTSRVYRIDVATGEATVLLDNQQGGMRTAELSPDGKTLYYTTMTGSIIRREIDGGLEKTLFTYPRKGPWAGSALSPNGEFIAVGSNVGTEKRAEGGVKKILLIPSQGGEVTELLRWDQEPSSFLTNTGWSPDGKTVLFTLHREPVAGKSPKAVNEFWQVPTDGSQPHKIMETDLNIPYSQGFRVHPDGQRIAFSVTTAHGELWVMENFLPEAMGK
jgi:beta-lactamase regulating signal transducer with metallopeptidase domain/Tol biopolymer transport system component